MNNILWYLLASTIPLAIIIMFAAFFITNSKMKKIKTQFTAKTNANDTIIKRKNPGELLWDLKNKSLNPLGDLEMEFAINTIIRNKYLTSHVFNSSSKYEETSMIKIANQKIQKDQFDFVILFNSSNLKNNFDNLYKNLNVNGMIMIVKIKKRYKNIQELLKYLKLLKIRNQYEKIGNGIILIVK